MTDVKAVEHVAEIRQVKTMADGTFNVTLNLPEYCADQATVYMQNNKKMVRIVGVIEEVDSNETTPKLRKIHI